MRLNKNRIFVINGCLVFCLQALILTNTTAKSFSDSMSTSNKLTNIVLNTITHFDLTKWKQLNYQYIVAGKEVCTLKLDILSANYILVNMHSGSTNISIEGSGRTVYIFLTQNHAKYFAVEAQPGETLWKLAAKYLSTLLPKNGLHALLLSKNPIPPPNTKWSIRHIDGDTIIRSVVPNLTDNKLRQLDKKSKAMNIDITQQDMNTVFMNLYAPFYLIINSQNSLPIEDKYSFSVPYNNSTKLLYVIERFQYLNSIPRNEIWNYKPPSGAETVCFGYFREMLKKSTSHIQ